MGLLPDWLHLFGCRSKNSSSCKNILSWIQYCVHYFLNLSDSIGLKLDRIILPRQRNSEEIPRHSVDQGLLTSPNIFYYKKSPCGDSSHARRTYFTLKPPIRNHGIYSVFQPAILLYVIASQMSSVIMFSQKTSTTNFGTVAAERRTAASRI